MEANFQNNIVWQQSWIKYHPGWQYILWTDEEIEKLNLVNKPLYRACKSYGAKSDIARYEILYRYGGLYVDCDFECLQPFDIFHHSCEFYASCDNAENGASSNDQWSYRSATRAPYYKTVHRKN